eukprot:TRINITY_DN9971_c0_g3_i1.p1 TRINITY_DN9971_c0_g3~~TRINITY_DN9971_c0_g3_i1.p1  ORF type:complete len:250 (+),score=11.31 TRINITY_DN9971_c0_g3_i1:194-943(+)
MGCGTSKSVRIASQVKSAPLCPSEPSQDGLRDNDIEANASGLKPVTSVIGVPQHEVEIASIEEGTPLFSEVPLLDKDQEVVKNAPHPAGGGNTSQSDIQLPVIENEPRKTDGFNGQPLSQTTHHSDSSAMTSSNPESVTSLSSSLLIQTLQQTLGFLATTDNQGSLASPKLDPFRPPTFVSNPEEQFRICPLPPGWQQAWSIQDQRYYFYKSGSDCSQWDFPSNSDRSSSSIRPDFIAIADSCMEDAQI